LFALRTADAIPTQKSSSPRLQQTTAKSDASSVMRRPFVSRAACEGRRADSRSRRRSPLIRALPRGEVNARSGARPARLDGERLSGPGGSVGTLHRRRREDQAPPRRPGSSIPDLQVGGGAPPSRSRADEASGGRRRPLSLHISAAGRESAVRRGPRHRPAVGEQGAALATRPL
jgi:hypothetical protein